MRRILLFFALPLFFFLQGVSKLTFPSFTSGEHVDSAKIKRNEYLGGRKNNGKGPARAGSDRQLLRRSPFPSTNNLVVLCIQKPAMWLVT